MNFVDVAIPTPLRTTFTYINKTSQTLLGKRVLVEFGRRKVVGVVIDEKADHNSKYKLKEVLETLDDMTPTFNKTEINQIIINIDQQQDRNKHVQKLQNQYLFFQDNKFEELLTLPDYSYLLQELNKSEKSFVQNSLLL